MKFAHKKESLFEASKLKELKDIIDVEQDDVDDMGVDELLAQVAYRALAEEKLCRIYWSDETIKLANLAVSRAKTESVEKFDIARAKIMRNEAQIIIRDPDHNNFARADKLLSDSVAIFRRLDMEHEVLFTEDEVLRTAFKFLVRNQQEVTEKRLKEIHWDWLVLLMHFEKFINKSCFRERDSAIVWYRNAIRHFLEFSACYGLPRYGYALIAGGLFGKDNWRKTIECILYGLGRFGYKIVSKIAE